MHGSRGIRLLASAGLVVSILGVVAVGDAQVHAATITVNTPGDPGPGTCSLREAVVAANTNAVVNGCAPGTLGQDVVVLAAGTFDVALGPIPVTEPLVIRGAGMATTIISGSGSGRLFDAGPAAAVTFEDLTMQNASGEGAVNSVADVTLTRARITEVSGATFGSGIFALGNVILTDSQIDHATGTSTVAIDSEGNVTISGSTISDNTGDGSGGGAVFARGTMTVTASTFDRNTGGDSGAIIGTGLISITDSSFTANVGTGGGIVAGAGGVISIGDVHVSGSTFTDNVTQNGSGGAIETLLGGDVVVSSSTFLRNRAPGPSGSGGAIGASAGVSVTDSYFNGNSAAFGGAIYAGAVSSLRSTFSANTGDFGSALGAVGANGVGGTFDVVSSTFDGNVTPGAPGAAGVGPGYGGALYSCIVDGTQLCVPDGPTSTVRMSTFAGNVSLAGADVFLEGTSAELAGNIFGPTGGGTNCAVLVGGTPISLGANISEDAVDSCALTATGDLLATSAQLGPLQVNAPGATPTRAIPASSPAVDHVQAALCTPGGETDQRGVVRGNGTTTGPLCDTGAFEFVAPPPATDNDHPWRRPRCHRRHCRAPRSRTVAASRRRSRALGSCRRRARTGPVNSAPSRSAYWSPVWRCWSYGGGRLRAPETLGA